MGSRVKPVVGKVYTLAEEDYRYGTGALLVKVTRVGNEVEYAGEIWFEVEAMVKPPRR